MSTPLPNAITTAITRREGVAKSPISAPSMRPELASSP